MQMNSLHHENCKPFPSFERRILPNYPLDGTKPFLTIPRSVIVQCQSVGNRDPTCIIGILLQSLVNLNYCSTQRKQSIGRKSKVSHTELRAISSFSPQTLINLNTAAVSIIVLQE